MSEDQELTNGAIFLENKHTLNFEPFRKHVTGIFAALRLNKCKYVCGETEPAIYEPYFKTAHLFLTFLFDLKIQFT